MSGSRDGGLSVKLVESEVSPGGSLIFMLVCLGADCFVCITRFS